MTYLFIFLSKGMENALGTLRLILVANGKKGLGAILQFMISILWISVTGIVIKDIRSDPLKVFFFGFGSFAGSYLGSILEEKIALGSNLILTMKEEKEGILLQKSLKKEGYLVASFKTEQKNQIILLIFTHRKKKEKLIKEIQKKNKNNIIFTQNIKIIT